MGKKKNLNNALEHYNNLISRYIKEKKIYELIELDTKDTRKLAFKYVKELKNKLSVQISNAAGREMQNSIYVGKYYEERNKKDSPLSVMNKLNGNIMFENWSLFPHMHYFEIMKKV
jgi:hypothetical protein